MFLKVLHTLFAHHAMQGLCVVHLLRHRPKLFLERPHQWWWGGVVWVSLYNSFEHMGGCTGRAWFGTVPDKHHLWECASVSIGES
jgi:hypothetical protein